MTYTILNLVSVAHKSKPIEVITSLRSGWFQLRVAGNLSRYNLHANDVDISKVNVGKFKYHFQREEVQSVDGVSTLFVLSVKDSAAIATGLFINGTFYVCDENPMDIVKSLFDGIRYIYPENDMLYLLDIPKDATVSSICGLLDNRLAGDHRTLSTMITGVNTSKYEVCVTAKYSHRFSPLNYSQLELILGKRKQITRLIRLSGEWYFLNRNRAGTISMIPYDEIV